MRFQCLFAENPLKKGKTSKKTEAKFSKKRFFEFAHRFGSMVLFCDAVLFNPLPQIKSWNKWSKLFKMANSTQSESARGILSH